MGLNDGGAEGKQLLVSLEIDLRLPPELGAEPLRLLAARIDRMENALLSKPKCWEYEQEYRILLLYSRDSECAFGAGMDTKKWYFEYPKEWLTGITFGMRLPNAYRKELAEYVRKAGYQNITWKEETLANNRFEIASTQIEI